MSQFAGSSTQFPSNPSADRARIFVVDDEQYMCDVCTRTLRRSGYDVVATTDASHAIEMLRNDPNFDLLLTDIRMPSISGLELAHQAREIVPSIAIIIMTGHVSMENLLQAVRRGAVEFLSKPFELEQLRLAVEQALHHRQLLQDSLRLQNIERLLQSSEEINASLERDELIKIILKHACQHTDCHATALLLYTAQRGDLFVGDDGMELQDEGLALMEQVHKTGQTSLTTSQAALCRYRGAPIYQGVATPLRAHGEVVGVLLFCDDQPHVLRSGTLESISILANQAGIALRNAALYGEIQSNHQRLQELDRLKGEFISIASHELRTPLSIVLGYTMMVRDQVQNEQHEYLQRVLDNAQRIKDIVDDMVNLRHLETGEMALQRQNHVLQSLVDQAVERMLPAAKRKQQEIRSVLPQEPISFQTDSEKFLLILGHLISNAIKFTSEGGPIEIRGDLWQYNGTHQNACLYLDQDATRLPEPIHQGAWVLVQVCDQGIGIPEREQPRIFERFYQVADSLTREQGGTGLGLAIVRELVTLQGGYVWVTSSEARGSIFSVALPYGADSGK